MFSFMILLAFVALVVAWLVALYNGLVRSRNAYRNAFAQIDVQLQRRFDLSPGDPAAMAELSRSQGALDGVLGRLMAVVEAYPDLKANQNMMQLSEELTSTENRVAFARQAYNDSVMAYNNKREVFPSSLVAGNFGFKPAALLDIPADRAQVREAPKVQF